MAVRITSSPHLTVADSWKPRTAGRKETLNGPLTTALLVTVSAVLRCSVRTFLTSPPRKKWNVCAVYSIPKESPMSIGQSVTIAESWVNAGWTTGTRGVPGIMLIDQRDRLYMDHLELTIIRLKRQGQLRRLATSSLNVVKGSCL